MKIKTTNNNEKINILRVKIKSLDFFMKYLNVNNIPDYRLIDELLLNEEMEGSIEFKDSMELDNFIEALINFRNKSRELCGKWRPEGEENHEY